MEALTEVVRAGKVRAIGFSEWTPEQIEASFDVADTVKFVSSQRLGPTPGQAGPTTAQLAIAWTLRRPELASAIVGASRPEQVHASGEHVVPEYRLAYGAQPGVVHR